KTRPRLTSHGPQPWFEAWARLGPDRFPWTFTFTRLSRSTIKGAKSGLNLRPSGAVMTGKPRSIQKLSLFQYSGVVPFMRRKVPGLPTRFLTSPPPSSGAGNSGLSAGSGRSVVYLYQGGRSSGGVGDHCGLSLPVAGA